MHRKGYLHGGAAACEEWGTVVQEYFHLCCCMYSVYISTCVGHFMQPWNELNMQGNELCKIMDCVQGFSSSNIFVWRCLVKDSYLRHALSHTWNKPCSLVLCDYERKKFLQNMLLQMFISRKLCVCLLWIHRCNRQQNGMLKQPWNTCVTFCALTIPNDQTLITLEHSAWSLHAILLLIGMAPKGE